ncbi:MAG: alpha/beta hydrolase [Solirubrobacterales bacterium]
MPPPIETATVGSASPERGVRLPRVRRRLAAPAALALLVAAALAGAAAGATGAPPSAATTARPFRAEVRQTRIGDTHVAWYQRGQGPPLVMLIGTGSTMAEWDPALLRLLARHHRLLLLDYPGLGRSGPWHGNSFDSLADAVAKLMATPGLPHRAAVLGWSMGGFVAQRLAIEHPGRVSRLILAGTNPGGSRAVLGSRRFQEIDSSPDPSEEQILLELYPPNRLGEGRGFLHRLEAASQSGEIPDDFRVPAATTDRQVAAEDPWLRSDANWRQLAGIAVPTLAAAGAGDPVVPPLNLRRIAARVPAGRYQRFAGRHAFLFQSRAAFSRAVERFLGSA